MTERICTSTRNTRKISKHLYLPYEIPHWLYISKFTRLRTVFRRQHGFGSCCSFDPSTSQVPRFWSQFRSATVTLHLSPHRLYPPWRRTDIISTHRKTQHNRHFIVQGRIELTTRWTRTGQAACYGAPEYIVHRSLSLTGEGRLVSMRTPVSKAR